MYFYFLIKFEDEEDNEDDGHVHGDHCNHTLNDFQVGIESLDRLSMALDPKDTFTSISSIANKYLQGKSWKERYVGLMMLANTCEGLTEQYEEALPSFLKKIFLN